jgi:phosphoribosylaminoimidazole-succinocarboxamide synthase
MNSVENQTPKAALFQTDLPLPNRRQGKVRDIYRLPAGDGEPARVLIVATDRISAFDVVLPDPIPDKGRLLTAISTEWFGFVDRLGLIDNHLISTDPADVPGLAPVHQDQLEGRMMLGRAARVIPVECVARGYVTGSGWTEYQANGRICGIQLPAGIPRCGRLPEPIFTPATKAEEGHDENIDFEQASAIAGRGVMERLRDLTLSIYKAGAEYAEERGIILADTKFEFGFALDENGEETDELILIDEVLTPDSSRFWPLESYEPGRDQDSFDKQYVRNYLLELVEAGTWDKTPPGPPLPPEIIVNTAARYEEAKRRLFG